MAEIGATAEGMGVVAVEKAVVGVAVMEMVAARAATARQAASPYRGNPG